MNLLTFDIEEWALAKSGGYGNPKKYEEYDSLLNRILDTLDETGTKATFFCTGQMAAGFPLVVRLIHSRGHEIGCHSNNHSWMNKMTEAEAREDTYRAVCSIEQCVGEKIISYRAPAFSIGEENKWMFEILAENGITRDSSVFPALRDIGGFPSFPSLSPCLIEYEGITIKEFPISVISFFHNRIAYSGGGYFRLLPLRIIRYWMAHSDYTICYFHINDILSEKRALRTRSEYEAYFKEPGTLPNRLKRHFKTNVGKNNAWNKLNYLIKVDSFHSLNYYDSHIVWDRRVIIF